eukprot:TRINITY_DN7824_c0_g3_i2.p1 TRINITY_DN7824_c0_g3~~TRINITY_DN7824_c0_g3_i2.p1  ORF type:complete len:987 (-),score=141.09 TRINITY_DN7824_c0_g3_i2:223-3183(-)
MMELEQNALLDASDTGNEDDTRHQRRSLLLLVRGALITVGCLTLTLLWSIRGSAAKDAPPLSTSVTHPVSLSSDVTCTCSTPNQGVAVPPDLGVRRGVWNYGPNSWSCTDGSSGHCAKNEMCNSSNAWPQGEEQANCCVPGKTCIVPEAVTCKCRTPSQGTIDLNGFNCSDGSSSWCQANQECYATSPWAKFDNEAACCDTGFCEATMCQCTTPNAGKSGHNGYNCTNGKTGWCTSTESCYSTELFQYGNFAAACSSGYSGLGEGTCTIDGEVPAWYQVVTDRPLLDCKALCTNNIWCQAISSSELEMDATGGHYTCILWFSPTQGSVGITSTYNNAVISRQNNLNCYKKNAMSGVVPQVAHSRHSKQPVSNPDAVCSCDYNWGAPHQYTCSDGTYNYCSGDETCQSTESFLKADYAKVCSAEPHCRCEVGFGFEGNPATWTCDTNLYLVGTTGATSYTCPASKPICYMGSMIFPANVNPCTDQVLAMCEPFIYRPYAWQNRLTRENRLYVLSNESGYKACPEGKFCYGQVRAEQPVLANETDQLCWAPPGPCMCVQPGKTGSYACANGTSGSCAEGTTCNGFGKFEYSSPRCGVPFADISDRIAESPMDTIGRAELTRTRNKVARISSRATKNQKETAETLEKGAKSKVGVKWHKLAVKGFEHEFAHVDSLDAFKKLRNAKIVANISVAAELLKHVTGRRLVSGPSASADWDFSVSLVPEFTFEWYPLKLVAEENILEANLEAGVFSLLPENHSWKYTYDVAPGSKDGESHPFTREYYSDKEEFELSEGKDWNPLAYRKIRGVTAKFTLGVWFSIASPQGGESADVKFHLGCSLELLPKFKHKKKEDDDDDGEGAGEGSEEKDKAKESEEDEEAGSEERESEQIQDEEVGAEADESSDSATQVYDQWEAGDTTDADLGYQESEFGEDVESGDIDAAMDTSVGDTLGVETAAGEAVDDTVVDASVDAAADVGGDLALDITVDLLFC